MESNKNPLTDEQLDDLLRDVCIPEDLKSQLAQIPVQTIGPASATKQPRWAVPKRSWVMLGLAASLIGIGLFAASRYTSPGPPTIEPTRLAGSPDTDTDTDTDTDQHAIVQIESPEPPEFRNELEQFMEGQAQLEAEIRAIEMAQLRAQLARLEQAASARIEQQEVESLIAAMSPQYAVPVGASRQNVQAEMNQVIERYPGTRGAQIAHEFLAQESH